MPSDAPSPLSGMCVPIVHRPDGSPVDGCDANQPIPTAATTTSAEPPASAARARRDSRRRPFDGHASPGRLHDREELDRLADALQLTPASRLELDREDGRRESPDGLADQDLARAGLCADPRGDVDGGPDVPAVGLHRLTGVNADTDGDRLLRCSPGVGDDRKPATDGAADGVEDDVEAVALGLDLRAAEASDRLPGERAVPRQQLSGRSGTTLLHEGGVAPEVREQEAAGDRASVFTGHGRSHPSPVCAVIPYREPVEQAAQACSARLRQPLGRSDEQSARLSGERSRVGEHCA